MPGSGNMLFLQSENEPAGKPYGLKSHDYDTEDTFDVRCPYGLFLAGVGIPLPGILYGRIFQGGKYRKGCVFYESRVEVP